MGEGCLRVLRGAGLWRGAFEAVGRTHFSKRGPVLRGKARARRPAPLGGGTLFSMKKALLFAVVAVALTAADYVAEGDLWWAHIQYLADDSLQGRDVGTEGYRKAAEYVAGKMET